MKVESYALTAGTIHTFDDPAKFFMLIETGAPLTVRFRKNGSRTRDVAKDVEAGYVSKPGNWADPDDRFDAFELQSSTNQTVRVGISDREGDYRRALALVQIEAPDALKSTADANVTDAAAQVIASNANRRSIVIQNTGAKTIRVAESNVAANRGVRLTANGSITLRTTAAIYAICETADDTSTVALLEETKS